MGRVIRFRGGRHREVQELLPWFLAGSLDAGDQERVSAHLSVCAECQEEVRFQKRLGPQIAELPLDVRQGAAAAALLIRLAEPGRRRRVRLRVA